MKPSEPSNEHASESAASRHECMMRFLLAGTLLLAACGGADGLVLEPVSHPEGTQLLALGELALHSVSWSLSLRASSELDHKVEFQVRFEGTPPPGATIRIRGESSLLPHGAGVLKLVFGTPRQTGPYRAAVVIDSPQRSGWERRFQIEGTMVERAFEGKVLQVQPAGVNLGEVERGERRDFSFALANVGTETLRLLSWETKDTDLVRLPPANEEHEVLPGGEFQLRGVITAPLAPGRFEARIRVQTDLAKNSIREIRVGGEVRPPYETLPDRLRLGRVHAPETGILPLRVRAREGSEPFVVAGVEGLGAYFEVASLGRETPDTEQTVHLRLKRDAPPGAIAGITLRVRLDPVGEIVECPVEGVLVASLIADPDRVDFGRISTNAPPTREVTIWHHANRPFKVTEVRTNANRFIVELRKAPGLPARVLITVPRGTSQGVLRDVLEITTDDESTPKIHVALSAQVIP